MGTGTTRRSIGRWVTRDPISEKGGVNIYAFDIGVGWISD